MKPKEPKSGFMVFLVILLVFILALLLGTSCTLKRDQKAIVVEILPARSPYVATYTTKVKLIEDNVYYFVNLGHRFETGDTIMIRIR